MQRTRPNARYLPAEPSMLTVDGVAVLLGCSPRTVHRLRDKGRIPQPIRIGGMIRWSRHAFERWIADGCSAPTRRNIRPKRAKGDS